MRPYCALLTVLALALAGCDLRKFTADSTADLIHGSSAQFNTLADVAFAEAAVPGNLATMESVYRVTPRNKDILIELVQAWTSYGFAFMEDHLEAARANDDEAGMTVYRARAQAAYRRARNFGMELLNVGESVEGGPVAKLRAGIAPWRAYLARFDEREDVAALYWTGNAWLSEIQLSLDDPSMLLDLPFAMALIDRAKQLDPEFYYGGVHLVYGLYYAGTPRELGGRPDLARAEFEAAMAATHRQLLINQVLYARTYAVQMQDRALFRRLLEEVLAAGDVLPQERLTNQVARRRARRYLAQIDELFLPQENPTP